MLIICLSLDLTTTVSENMATREPHLCCSEYGAHLCTTDGWLVWLRCIYNSIRFNKTWEEYERGFGYPGGNLWLGLEKLYKQKHVQVIDGY